VAKKLSEIESIIKSKHLPFFNYLHNILEGEIFDFLQALSKKTNVYIFSGIIRNYFLETYLVRDIDVVIESEIPLLDLLHEFKYNRNSFGGYKIEFTNKTMDIWSIDKTWAFNYQKTFDVELEKRLPSTSFFNFSAIVYSINNREFIYTKEFLRFLRDRSLDYVYTPNANNSLCVVNTFYYADRYNLKINRRLITLIRYLHDKGKRDYDEIQMKHFKQILYTTEELESRLKLGK
jgi:hypothetical protein